MKHRPMKEEDFNSIFSAGEYKYEVIDAKEEISKSGNPMIHLQVKLFSQLNNSTTLVHDYLISESYKLRHICYTIGLQEMYESGEIHASNFLRKSGIAKVSIKKGEPKISIKENGQPEKIGMYPDKNVINDYIDNDKAKPAQATVLGSTIFGAQKVKTPIADAHAKDLEDEIPF